MSADGKIIPFTPGSRKPAAKTDVSPPLPSDDGALALDMTSLPFDIDEPDPLLVSDGRGQDLNFSNMPVMHGVRVVSGEHQGKGQKSLRLRDFHPMDLVIILGIIIVTLII